MRATTLHGTDTSRHPGPGARLLSLLALVLPVLVGGGVLAHGLPVLFQEQTWHDLGRSTGGMEWLSMILCLDAAALLCVGWGLAGLWAALHLVLQRPGNRRTLGALPQDHAVALPRLPRTLRRTVWILVGAQAALALPGMPAQARTSPASPEETSSVPADTAEVNLGTMLASSDRGSPSEEAPAAPEATTGTDTPPSASSPRNSPEVSPLFGTALPDTTTAVSTHEAEQASSVSVIQMQNSAQAEQLSPLFGGRVRSPESTVEQRPTQNHSTPADGAGHREWVVLRGQTLWDIAATRLPSGASSGEITRMVATIYDHNRDVLVDGPDLILPGMVLDLTAT